MREFKTLDDEFNWMKKTGCFLFSAIILGNLAFWGVVIWVAGHFIKKYW